MRYRRIIITNIFYFVLFIFITSFISCEKKLNVKTIRLAHGLDVNHSVHLAMLNINSNLKKLSKGKLQIKIYPNQQLGSERECLELLQIGSLDMTKVSAAVLENFAPKLKIFSLPFLFDDKKHLFKVLDGQIGTELLKEMEKYFLKGLCYYDSGSRSFYTKNYPITEPKDLKGLKIRVQESVTAINMVKNLGGSPTPISWGELYTALQQGVVDGAENNSPSFYLSKHYEICKFYSIDEHTMIPDILIISIHMWNRLDKEEKNWLKEAINKSVSYQRELWEKAEKKALKAVIDAGVKVSYPEKKAFQKLTKKIYKIFEKDSTMAQLIERISNEAG